MRKSIGLLLCGALLTLPAAALAERGAHREWQAQHTGPGHARAMHRPPPGAIHRRHARHQRSQAQRYYRWHRHEPYPSFYYYQYTPRRHSYHEQRPARSWRHEW